MNDVLGFILCLSVLSIYLSIGLFVYFAFFAYFAFHKSSDIDTEEMKDGRFFIIIMWPFFLIAMLFHLCVIPALNFVENKFNDFEKEIVEAGKEDETDADCD